MTTPHPQVLSIPQRNYILRQYVDTEMRNNESVTGQVSSTGRITLQKKGPHVTAWGDTWADVAYGWRPTDPRVILVNVLLTSLCCGLWLPFWFFPLFKKPPEYRLSIDEYGYQHSIQHEISRGQKTLRWVLIAVIVLIGLLIIWVMGSIPESSLHPKPSGGPLGG